MVSKFPPHKRSKEISSAFHRYAMVVLGLHDEDSFCASQLELFRNGPSYTIETMDELSVRHPDWDICFVAGTDSLSEIHLWHEYDKLFARHCLVFVQRPGAVVALNRLEISPALKDSIRFVDSSFQPEIRKGRAYCLDLQAPDVSSTDIRRKIALHEQPGANHLTPSVYKYIRKHRLYE